MDAKSLLRAKKAEARITHPYATYNASGVLRCSICAVPAVKQWDAHLLTKQHRTSVAREKAEKEKAERVKRPRGDEAEPSSKRPKVQPQPSTGPSNLPAGFFSAGNAPPPQEPEPEPEVEMSAPVVPPPKTGDADLDDFFASLADDTPAPVSSTAAPPTAATQAARRKTYQEDLIPGQASYEAAPVRNVPKEEEAAQEPEEEETEGERKERLEREEREEIVQRLEDEERAQEDADSRVTALKQRMELMKKKREARANAKGKGKANGA
ncbi:zinc finger protein 830 [Cryptococcus wingfieldii CBS 7118]|uniref:Zinc finger protein 830 n=1 Tax=Cryptococcus wingfieldii CBS 7118 TaxID=1295528 RepID=A0A1E3JRU1_9TREE|nr:zinc finger protein 830 [Cryptococcus wingfieldii CBS 7118]ODO03580.1 zinc finger protein 830 [Cryptococcus wingfieldii CBS 7118]